MVTHKWVKVFQNGPSKIYGRYLFQFFKGCLPQILLAPFMITLNQTLCAVLSKERRELKEDIFTIYFSSDFRECTSSM